MVSPDVGGGFGYKGKHYPEEAIVAWAARRLRRPVRWIATRSECFVSDHQARDHTPTPSLRSTRRAISSRCASTPSPISAPMSRPSAPPSRARSTARCWPASTARPRSPSNPPACSPTRCRPTPIAAPAGRRPATCWSGSPTTRARARPRSRRNPPAQSRAGRRHALQDADRADLRLRRFPEGVRARARDLPTTRLCQAPRAGRASAAGCAASASRATWNPPASRRRALPALGARVGFYEAATIRVEPDGSVHARSAPTITARATPPPSRRSFRRGSACRSTQIEIIEGDTDQVPYGTGTFGSRSIAVGGSALDRAAARSSTRAS